MKKCPIILFLGFFIFLAPCINAQTSATQLKVGYQIAPPFVITDTNGVSGLGIDLWKQIADSMNVDFSLQKYDLDGLLKAIESGEIDVAISPLTVTASRMTRFNFSQPYYITNLAFAMKIEKSRDLVSFFLNFFTFNFFKAIFSLFLVILIFGLVVWLLEKKRNSAQFRKGLNGIGDGIWWSAVTMSTVGYGDKSPVTAWGRLLSVVWIFTGVIIISGLTAGISSSLTVHQLKTEINGLDDLRKVKVGCVPGTGTADFLNRYRVKFIDFNTVDEGLVAVQNDKIAAFVYDYAALSYYVNQGNFDEVIEVIPSSYYREYFSFASHDYALLKPVNESLIKVIESNDWSLKLKKYHLESYK
jgi:ABC-type amino acid transport substrate-binding protein